MHKRKLEWLQWARECMLQRPTQLGRLCARLLAFVYERTGNVTITFALALIPMMGLVGAAVDYSHASLIKTAMQSAADSTALAISKTAGTITSGQLQASADGYFRALFTRTDTQNLAVATIYTTSGGTTVTLNASATMPTTFMGIMGFKTLAINVTGIVSWGTRRLRVALVLDNTGSMANNGKITALQTATKSLLSQLKAAATNSGDVYVSIIPFSKDMNVGTTNYSASWVDWTDWDANNGSCSRRTSGSTQSSCSGTWTPDNHNTWNGCVMDRGGASSPSTQNYDQTVSAPVAGIKSSLFPTEQYDYCPLQIMGLSYDWATMNSLVNQMYPDGSTNQPIGLVWGWISLVGLGPLTAPPLDPSYKYSQVIILLSDGLNTQDHWYGNGSDTSTQVDNRMYASGGSGTCANVKAAGITIYAVQVNTGGNPTSTLLQNCASDSSKFFLLTTASEIITTFNTIGTNLSQLRISK